MSGPRYSIIPGDAVLDRRIAEVHLRVLCVLGRHTDNQGWCEVSQKKMADNLGYSREGINRAFKQLVEFGYIEKHEQFRNDGGRGISRYRVLMDRPDPCDVEITGPVTIENQYPCDHEKSQLNDPYSNDHSVSNETGPSPSKRFWDETTTFLKKHYPTNSDDKIRSLVGGWFKRIDGSFEKFNAILTACQNSGTHEPIKYLSKAVNEQWPPRKTVNPKNIPRDRWAINLQVALDRREWSKAWGPPPGAKGCHVPKELITPELLNAFKPAGVLV